MSISAPTTASSPTGGYVSVPIETDPDILANDAFDFLSNIEGMEDWEPSEGQIDVWLIQALARMAATARDVASEVPTSIFRYFGSMVGVPPIDASPASASVTIVAIDNSGYQIRAGTHVGLDDGVGNAVEFFIPDTIDIIAGTTTVTGVTIIASLAGSDGANLGAPGDEVIPLDTLAGVSTITLETATLGGTDAEPDSAYLDRLAQNLRLMSPRPILPEDFALISRNIAGVSRSLALDGYNPADDTDGNARTVTVALADASGNSVGPTIRTQVEDYLQSLREANFIVHAIDPTYTTVDVEWDVTAWTSFDIDDVHDRVETAVAAYLDPATWGTPPFGGATNRWFLFPTVKVNDLIAQIGRLDGVRDVNSVLLRTGTDPYTATDVPLDTPAPLAQLGTQSGTVH